MHLKFEGAPVVSQGGSRKLFVHPERSDWLVKVYLQRFHDVNIERYPLTTKFRRLKLYWALINELIEFVAIRENPTTETKYLQTIIGTADTDYGLGMIVEGIFSEDGSLAFTLRDLVLERKYEDKHQRELEKLFSWMSETDIIIRDFSLDNLVWDYKKQCFVIIDGIGSKATLSLRSFSKAYNSRENRKRIAKFRKRLKNLREERVLNENTC
jgi:hypothetical protein